jgi:hypothetical protein
MHSNTYGRPVQAICNCEERRNAAFAVDARRLGIRFVVLRAEGTGSASSDVVAERTLRYLRGQ